MHLVWQSCYNSYPLLCAHVYSWSRCSYVKLPHPLPHPHLILISTLSISAPSLSTTLSPCSSSNRSTCAVDWKPCTSCTRVGQERGGTHHQTCTWSHIPHEHIDTGTYKEANYTHHARTDAHTHTHACTHNDCSNANYLLMSACSI